MVDELDGEGAILDPWDRGWADESDHVSETAAAYAAFLKYRDLPVGGRTARRTVPLIYGPDFTEDHPLFRAKLQQTQVWMAMHAWIARCSAWDRDVADHRRAVEDQVWRDMCDKHATIAGNALARGISALADLKITNISDVVKVLDLGYKMERLARGGDKSPAIQQSGDDIRAAAGRDHDVPPADALRETLAILVESNLLPPEVMDALNALETP